jgi:predicted RNA methylase
MGRFLSYLATFPVGLEEPFARALTARYRDVRLLHIGAGIAWFTTRAAPSDVARWHAANNIFHVLAQVRGTHHDLGRALHARKVHIPVDVGAVGFRSFYLVGWEHGTPMSPLALVSIERAIAASLALRPRDRAHGVELSVMVRREGRSFLLRRLSGVKRGRTEPGQLSPALSALLCALSEASPSDVFLDPFCGSGAIPIERVRSPHRIVYASDIDPVVIRRLARVVARGGTSRRLQVQCADAIQLPYRDASISHLVTDPPWGLYRRVNDLSSFYTSMLDEHARVVRAAGTLIYLTAATATFEDAVRHCPRLQLERTHRLLVAGKKAAVFVLRRCCS